MYNAFLTIDWDYFVPEKLDWKFYQEEKRLYLSVAWKRRINYLREMCANGEQDGFWKRIKGLTRDLPYYVSDSHLAAYRLKELHDSDIVVIIDAHHDIFKIDNDGPDCGTWLAFWLKAKKERKAYWVKPAHSICVDPVGFSDQIIVLDKVENLPSDLNYSGVHICRSGCWTPPWTDAAFNDFVKDYHKTYKIIGKDWCLPMALRWADEDYQDAHTIQEQNTDYFRHLAKTPVPLEYVVKFKEENYRFL